MQEEPAQEVSTYRLILVDTNCFLKLYQSPIRPFLGRAIGENRLVTMNAMIDEFMRNPRLQETYAWLAKTINADIALDDAILKVDAEKADEIKELMDSHAPYADALLADHCDKEQTKIKRSLSRSDLELLATAISLEALVATDEWPLRLVIDDLAAAPEEDGYNLGGLNSLDILAIFEKSGAISGEQRKDIVRGWLQFGEILPRDWRNSYLALFGEIAPTA